MIQLKDIRALKSTEEEKNVTMLNTLKISLKVIKLEVVDATRF